MAEANLDNNNSPDLTTKFYTHFLYKAIFVSIFLLLLPLFPWQAGPPAPDHTTSSGWELLQLVFVGIAVSYGLFSKRNDETRKEEGSSDNTESHTYVARLLQVSSVFDDDDDDDLRGAESRSNSKVVQKTWNSQYYRGESSTVVVPKKTSVLDDNDIDNITTTTTTEKQSPLLLPVHSLKNRATESSMTKQLNKSYSFRQMSSCKISGADKEEENTVLRSPIPWRSRSGRLMEVKEDNKSPNASFRSSSSSLNILASSQSPRTSSEVQSQQDVGQRNKSSFKQVPAPPPPPPPPVNRNYTHNRRINMYAAGNGMEFKRYVPSENKVREGAELTIKTENDNSLKLLKTPKETQEYLSHDKEIESFILTRGASHGKRNTEFFTDDDDDDVDQNTQTSIENPSENKKEFFMETVAAKDSDESEEEADDDELQELASKKNSSGDLIMDNGGPDVDKKADEFIAKFREQIRLQRIASIRRSTATALTPKNVNSRPSKR